MGDMVRGNIILCFFNNIKEVIESVNEEDATSIKFAQKVYRNEQVMPDLTFSFH